jgi:signal transduction histidine kinase
LLIKTEKSGEESVSVAVQDSGTEVDPATADRAFEAFYKTKPEGLGMGLSICRSDRRGAWRRVGVDSERAHGAVLQFTVPIHGNHK